MPKHLQLSDLQKYRIKLALHHSTEILNQIKQQPLKGPQIDQMKMLEQSVQALEIFNLGAGRH
jgi:hypothetical protein